MLRLDVVVSGAITPIIFILSWLLATLAVRGRARHIGVVSGMMGDLSWWAALGALIGARLAYVTAHWPLFAGYPQDVILTFWHGLDFFGGLVGATLAGALWARRRGLSVRRLSAAAAPALPLGVALARFGFLGIDVRTLGLLGSGQGLTPGLTGDLLEGLLCLGLSVTVSYRARPGAPSPFVLGMVGYGLIRATADLMRPATGPWFLTDQALSVALAMLGLAILLLGRARKPEPATADEEG